MLQDEQLYASDWNQHLLFLFPPFLVAQESRNLPEVSN